MDRQDLLAASMVEEMVVEAAAGLARKVSGEEAAAIAYIGFPSGHQQAPRALRSVMGRAELHSSFVALQHRV